METPTMRFNRRMKENGITPTLYGIACDKHGNRAPAVYDSHINNYRCRPCLYQELMSTNSTANKDKSNV